jgi:hypothetical protein
MQSNEGSSRRGKGTFMYIKKLVRQLFRCTFYVKSLRGRWIWIPVTLPSKLLGHWERMSLVSTAEKEAPDEFYEEAARITIEAIREAASQAEDNQPICVYIANLDKCPPRVQRCLPYRILDKLPKEEFQPIPKDNAHDTPMIVLVKAPSRA